MSEIQFVRNNESENSAADRIPAENTEKKKKRNKKKKAGWTVLIIVLVIAVFGAGFGGYYLLKSGEFGPQEAQPYIGVLRVEGTIQSSASVSSQYTYQHDWLLRQLDTLIEDPQNTGLMLFVNSPGGSVYQADELYLKLKEYKETTERPLYVYFGETAASGGYYIAAPADYICANRNTITGSIGVYMGPMYSMQELLEKLGVKVDIIRSSRNKAMGSGYEDLTDEQKAIYQSLVDEMYQQFVNVVAEGRKMSQERVRQIADGRVYTANQALYNGLIDKICSYEEALEFMKTEESLDCETVSISYKPPKDLYSTLFGLQQQIAELSADASESEAESILRFIEENAKPGLYYLMTE